MWMYEVHCTNGVKLQAYKHIDTREYLHLAPDGCAYFFESPNDYVPIRVLEALKVVFYWLPALGGVDAEQLAESRAAIDRIQNPSYTWGCVR